MAPPHTYYGAANTASSTGEIIGIPNNLEWAPLVTNFGVPLKTLLYTGGTSGIWEAGVACAKSGVVSDYWNTAVTFTSSTTDANKFAWSDTPGACKASTITKFYTAATATFTKNQAGSFIAASSGCPAPTITETGKLPTGVTLKTGGVISGKPTVTGTFKVTLSAKVGTGKAATQAFSLVVKS